jgi:hypothetical protein
MLGYSNKGNDIFVYFENDEIKRQSKEKIKGNYINLNYPQEMGLLETIIDDEACRKQMNTIITDTQKKQNGAVISMKLSMMQKVYDKIAKNGIYESHEGFRHIRFMDANNLHFADAAPYAFIKGIYFDNSDSKNQKSERI